MSLGAAAFTQWEMLAPPEVDTSIVELLRDNTEEVKKDAADILVKLLSNIIADPNNMKYRQVKLANKKIEEKLLPASGAFEILFSVGFEEAEEQLILPLSSNVRTLEKFRDAIKNIDKKSVVVEAARPAQSVAAPQPVAAATVAPSQSSVLLQPGALAREREFLGRLVSCLAHMDAFEGAAAQVSVALVVANIIPRHLYLLFLQQKALSVMPVEQLKKAAKTKFETAKTADPTLSEDLFDDILLLEMKEWFKTDFFSWVDSPACPSCSAPTQSSGMCSPTVQEQQDGAGRVEGYKCTQCGQQGVRFPRYHSKPCKLLETRKGR